ncbi:MAG: hypothetical protein JSV97_06490 [candidate division WOR-3 bacterium]|nr:MAG: hypothetical protein JSV97_06490 [candidate division WOR-3 bacterium]
MYTHVHSFSIITILLYQELINCPAVCSQILYCIYDEKKLQSEILVMNIDGTNAGRLCVDGVDQCWSPNGTEIVYVKYNFTKQAMTCPGYGEIWLMDADGSNQRQLNFDE